MVAVGTIVFLFGLFFLIFAGAYAWFFLFNKKDGLCDVLEERADGTLVVLKSNIAYRFKGRTSGSVDSMKIGNYKDCKPIDKHYAVSWLNKKCDKMYILRDKDGFFHPMKPMWDEKEKSLKLKPNYRETIDWIVNEFVEKDKNKLKTGTLEKYMPQIVLAIVFLFAFISMFYNWQHEKEMLNKMQGELQTFEKKLASANNLYDPVILQKAMQIVAQYQIEKGTSNWTQTIVTNGGIQVNT